MISISQAKKYCSEDISLIKNYAEAVADTTQEWICHHINGEPFTGFNADDLIKMNMYTNRPAAELMFVTRKMHDKIHGNAFKGKKHSEKTKQHWSKIRKGREPWNKGKHNVYSDETLAKMSKPCSEEKKSKISASLKGKHIRLCADGKRHWV